MRGEHAIKGLRREASMYTGPLRKLQGKVVPVFYGFFTGNVEGVDIGCIVLEWCEDWELTHKPPPKEEMNERLKAVRELHAAGVKHGKLYKTRDSVGPFDSRHFLHDKHGATRIVGFQHASMHKCAGGLGKHDDVKACLDDKCRELCYVEVHWRRACGVAPEARWQPF
ncbi:uncharacterized protein TRAVEDRAFT_110356 [Trametes versicolor FP-101664 SS1]|uniref:uncharacterized protein n=1 Tax=Trametes versicolor (strain FP-101664) TaxID=717944 RepID=UPI00046223BE|nr:uncharacterized protein TRAVEDRAFT_110356 [Trametes versicolor FP-101664 SS1]EIW64084.1 hypothetical protein TRAVEDRAFT_110356 [Trametes versicolor FP-101664 SS1]